MTPDERVGAFKTASFILDAALMRETRAVNSVLDITGEDPASRRSVTAAEERVHQRVEGLRSSLAGFFESVAGTRPGAVRLNAAEEAADRRVPVNIDDVDRYLSDRPRPQTGLTSLMTFSTWGHVDGRSSVLDIYKQVMAEAKVHGAWYYGSVSLDQVERTLDAGLDAGILRLR